MGSINRFAIVLAALALCECCVGHQASLDLLMDSLKKEGVVDLSTNFFSAADHQTITKFASKNGVTAIQLEINSAWLVPEQGGLYAHRFTELMQALVRYVVAEGKIDTSLK